MNVLKWHGGKHYLAAEIIKLMPPHIHYVEPYAGGLSVLLAKEYIGVSEVVNDLNGLLINFWRVLADPALFAEMIRILQATPCSESAYDAADTAADAGDFDFADRVGSAVRFFIRCRQSRAGTFKGFTTLAKTRVRRGMNELPSAWWSSIDGMAEVHDRLSRVVILCRDAIDVIKTEDGVGTLFYCDPPYLHSTRQTLNAYSFEMSENQHIRFLTTIGLVAGRVMVSGYDSELYNDMLKGWTRHLFDVPNNAASGETKRRMTEVVWTNF